MPRLSLIPTLLRETFGSRRLPREPEPDLVMEGEQVESYAEAGRIDGVMSAAYLFHSARISAAIQGCRQVLDLGCGPATQLGQVAQLNPDISFLGLDLSEEMLADGQRHVASLGLRNVSFQKADITRLAAIEDQSTDAVISTMALHHLPTLNDLTRCFREINRILRPQGGLYLVDFSRMKSLKSVIFFAYLNADNQPPIFSLDYERSLRAAFLESELSQAARQELPPAVESFSTFGIPVLTLLKTPDRKISPPIRRQLQVMRRQLPARYRRELDDIRYFYRLGGLSDDPFK